VKRFHNLKRGAIQLERMELYRNDFGAGIMFIPSGLGYYAAGSASIPSYSPLVLVSNYLSYSD
jgi:hypothetical protein